MQSKKLTLLIAIACLALVQNQVDADSKFNRDRLNRVKARLQALTMRGSQSHNFEQEMVNHSMEHWKTHRPASQNSFSRRSMLPHESQEFGYLPKPSGKPSTTKSNLDKQNVSSNPFYEAPRHHNPQQVNKRFGIQPEAEPVREQVKPKSNRDKLETRHAFHGTKPHEVRKLPVASHSQEVAKPKSHPARHKALSREPQRSNSLPAEEGEVSESGGMSPEVRIVRLLERCQKISPYLEKNTSRGEKARKLYARHCSSVVEKLTLPQNLDVFYPIHGKYLSMIGEHKQANAYLTRYYQRAPGDFYSNYHFINNLVDLRQAKMAMGMFEFFKQNQKGQVLDEDQRELMHNLELYVKSIQPERGI